MVVDVEGATERRDFPWGWIGAEGLEQPLPAARRSCKGRPLPAVRRICRDRPPPAARRSWRAAPCRAQEQESTGLLPCAGVGFGASLGHAQGLEHGALEFAGKRVTGRGREGAGRVPPQTLSWRHGGRRGLGERAASRGRDGEGRGPVNGDKVRAFMSFASTCFLIFFFSTV